MFDITPEHDAMLTRAMSGDRESLVRLLEEFGGVVRSRIAPKVKGAFQSSFDPDDVMQVTYLEAVTRFSRFEGGGASGFLAWLTRLAENNLRDAIRALEAAKRPNPHKRVQQNRDESSLGLIELLGATYSTPSRVAATTEAKSFLDRALAKLPGDYEKVIRLYDLMGRSIAEVSQELGRSEGAVYMLRARAHDRLRELIGTESMFFTVTG